MNWEHTIIELGTLRVNHVTKLIYRYLGATPELIKISNVKVSCGCSVPEWNPETKELKIIYTPNPVPTHLIQQGKNSYHSSKYILVDYGNGVIDKLIFNATVTK
jgi:hypothetical protein